MGNTIRHILIKATIISLILFLLAYNKGSASEDFRTFDSNDSVLSADFSVPVKPMKQKNTSGNCEAYRPLIEQYDWDAKIMEQIMFHESACNPNAVNDNPKTKDLSISLFQINLYGENARHRPSKEWLMVPENNVAYAYELFKSQGYKAWGVCRKSVKCI